MSDLDRFEFFIHVAQAESLSKAADAIGMNKAALSKQIKRLENDFRVDLFYRHQQRLKLTDQGTALLAQCLRLKKELDETRTICEKFLEEPEGTLRIVAFSYFANKLIFPKIRDFLEKYPKLKLIIHTDERIPDFEREQVDLAVGFSLPVPLDIVRKKITSSRYVLCASPDYFSKKNKPTCVEDLPNHFYIEHTGRPLKSILHLKPPHKISLQPHLWLNSVSAMIECAKQGVGMIQLPFYLLENILLEGKLIEVLADEQGTMDVYFYYPKFRYVQPKVRKFIDFFLS